MVSLSQFGDFIATTGPAFMTSANDVVNLAQLNTYTLRRMLKGKGPEEVIQGGSEIRDTVMFDEDSTFTFYDPNDTFTWENPQVLENWSIPWRFGADHMSWTDQEVTLNGAMGSMSLKAQFHQYKQIKRRKEARMWTSILNGKEKHLWAVPKTENMEANTGKQPFSIPAYVNEQTNGLFYSDATPTGETAWTTKMGLNPASREGWRPVQHTYSSSAVNNSDNIISNFDEMFLDVQFTPPPSHEEYFETPHLNAQVIMASKRGITAYKQLLRASQDTFVTTDRQDPAYMTPKFSGIDLMYISTLNTAQLYWDGASGGTNYDTEIPTDQSSTGIDSGPRYYWLNCWYLKPVWHETRYMMLHEEMRHPNQPFSKRVPVDSWYNIVCRAMNRQGILSPSGVVYS